MTTFKIRSIMASGLHRATVACMLLACMSGATSGVAQEASAVTADAAAVQPFVLETTFLIVKVDSAQLGLPDLNVIVESMSAEAQATVRQTYQRAGQSLKMLREMVDDQPIYGTVGIGVSQDRQPVFAFVRASDPSRAERLMASLKNEMRFAARVEGDYVVANPVSDFFEIGAIATPPRKDLVPAWSSVANYPVQVLLLPPAYWLRMMHELPIELPKQLGGGSSSVLTEGVQWAALGFDPVKLRTELIIHSTSDEAARKLAANMPKMIGAAYAALSEEMNDRLPAELAQTLVNLATPQVDGNRITVRIDGLEKNSTNLRLLAIVAKVVEGKSRRRRNSNRFKQIVLGMHNYHDTFKSFPPADKYRGDDGKHHLSWRVHLLPYIEEMELYKQFHLDEPWDSPHNKKLLKEMPNVFTSDAIGVLPDATIKSGHTTFLAPVGEGTAFGQDKAATFRMFRDGTSNTVVLVEVKPEEAVPWTAPADYDIDPEKPADGVLIGSDGRWLCAFADGSVHQLRGDIPAETMLHLFQMSDGHSIDYKKIR